MYCHFHDTNHPKWRAVAKDVEPPKSSGGEFDKLDLEALEAEFENSPDRDLDPPPESPLRQPKHFEPPPQVSVGMSQQEEQPDVDVEPVDPSFADLLEGEADVEMATDTNADMVNTLRYFGVELCDAQQFVASVAEPLSTFMEVYGRGGIVDGIQTEAEHQYQGF